MDENRFKEDYREAMDSITVTDEEKKRVIEMYEGKNTKVTDISRTGRRGLSKVAVALIALAGVLTLSGGVAWAMTSSPLKDYFFKNSDVEFEDVYTPVLAEYEFGNVKAVYDGSIYEKATETGYLSFSFYDKAGNPINLEDFSNVRYLHDGYTDNMMLSFHTFTSGIKIGEDKFYLVLLNLNSVHTILDKNNLFIRFERNYIPDEGNDAGFIVLNAEQFENLKADVAQLDPETMFAYNYDQATGEVTSNVDNTVILPQVLDILKKYTITEVQCIDAPAQEILVEDMKINVGRADVTLLYNINDCEIDAFTLIREDGTRIEFTKQEYIDGYNGEIAEDTLGNMWTVSGIDATSRFGGGSKDDDGNATYTYNFGYILGINERVKIEANGKIYE